MDMRLHGGLGGVGVSYLTGFALAASQAGRQHSATGGSGCGRSVAHLIVGDVVFAFFVLVKCASKLLVRGQLVLERPQRGLERPVPRQTRTPTV